MNKIDISIDSLIVNHFLEFLGSQAGQTGSPTDKKMSEKTEHQLIFGTEDEEDE